MLNDVRRATLSAGLYMMSYRAIRSRLRRRNGYAAGENGSPRKTARESLISVGVYFYLPPLLANQILQIHWLHGRRPQGILITTQTVKNKDIERKRQYSPLFSGTFERWTFLRVCMDIPTGMYGHSYGYAWTFLRVCMDIPTGMHGLITVFIYIYIFGRTRRKYINI
jgi:hypothetical protein